MKTTDLILGTAGHIDHGKTSLIGALTGVNTDRLPEEQKRGITIDLGFAELTVGAFRFGIVDVPGHERFVRNMLVGATGMDVAMLVVAADDSVKTQTREHLEILRLLDLGAGVIALTKCDLVEADWLDLVEEEIRDLVADTFLAAAPIIRTSSATGAGMDELRAALETAGRQAAAGGAGDGPFRMAIDRTFAIEGHGTVVTGSVGSGTLRVGDEVMLEPGGGKVRIRGLQNHDRTVTEIHRGQRAAINLGGVHHDELRRGQELAAAGHLQPSRLLTVDLTLLESAPRPLKNRSRVRLHVGSAELLATVVLLNGESTLAAGERTLAQVFLAEPAVTTWSQPFVIRSESPVLTIGGGQVLDPDAEKLRRPEAALLERVAGLKSSDPIQRAAAALYCAGLRGWSADQLPRTAGVSDYAAAAAELLERGDLCEVKVSPTRTFRLHRDVLDQLCLRIEKVLEKLHADNPLRRTINRHQLTDAFRYLENDPLLNTVINKMRKERRIETTDRGVRLVGRGPKLSQNETKVLAQLIQIYREAGLETPTVKQVQKQVTKNQDSVPALVTLAATDGDLVEITDEYFLHSDTEADIRRQLADELSGGEGLTLSRIRELLNTSRKYAVPLCEYFDRIGFTRRDGDLRVLATGVAEAAE